MLATAVAESVPSLPPETALGRRGLQARLQIVIDSLMATIVFNPLLTAICVPAFAIPGSPFGQVPLPRLALAIGLQLLSAATALYLYRRYRRVELDKAVLVERLLIAGQILFSGAWGIIAFLWWLPGNPVNQVFVIMVMAVVSYSIVFARSTHMRLLGTALLVQGGLTFLRLVTSGEELAHIMAPMILVYATYLWMMGRGSNRQISATIKARFANEDLAEALRRARDEAVRKRYEAETANASKTAFLANMSHELRTPLNAILGFSDIIAHQSMGGPDQIDRYSDYATDIHSSGTHLLSLINDLLDVAKIESGRMEIEPRWIDPGMVVDGVSRLMSTRATQKRQALTIEVAPETPLVLADERAFRQMLLNLLSNAVKFTPEGGHIAIACAGTPAGLEVTVTDDGPGIPEDKLSRVLEPFSQIDNRFDREAGGTGLGLALVDGLVRLHGGTVVLKSSLGAGVRATLYFPSTMTNGETQARAG